MKKTKAATPTAKAQRPDNPTCDTDSLQAFTPHSNGAQALQYAARGLRVLPVWQAVCAACACGNPDCESVAKHPHQLVPNGVHDATADAATITRWWTEAPDANVGIATGDPYVVVDVDPRNGGMASIDEFERTHQALPDTVRVDTGGGGLHLYYAVNGTMVAGRSGWLAGVDVKSTGGYVLAPPSNHASGRTYTFQHDMPQKPAQLPDWLAQEINGSTGTTAQRLDMRSILDGVPEGQRDDALFRYACRLRGDAVPYDAAVAAVLDAARRCKPPFDEKAARRKADGAYEKYAPAAAPLIPPRIGADTAATVTASRDFHRTDTGNAELFTALHGDKLRYDHRRQRWFIFREHHWRLDHDAEIQRYAKDVALQRYARAAAMADEKERAREAQWAVQCESGYRQRCLLTQASCELPIATAGDKWNRDPFLLGVANGVVDLRTGNLRPGVPEDMITLCTDVAFDPDATCPRFEQFLAEVFNEDDEVIGFVQRMAGYSLTGDVSEELLVICYGTGANGKSKLHAVLRDLAGQYAYNMPFSTIELKNRAAIPNDLAALVDRRLVSASETGASMLLNEARIKALTGRDPITARFLFGEFFEFQPVAHFWLACNHKPRVADTSDGFWRRVRLVPFTRQFLGDQADTHLDAKLRAELPGILNWAVEGCLDWQTYGLGLPAAVKAATQDYRDESDALADFLAECCDTGDPGATATGGDLYKAYCTWAQKAGIKDDDKGRLSHVVFGSRLKERFTAKKEGRVMRYHGIGLAQPDMPLPKQPVLPVDPKGNK